MNNNILVCFPVCRVLSKIGQLWDEEQVIRIMIVLHRSDGEKGTEDTDRKFKRKGTPAAVFDVDLEVTLTVCVVSGSLHQSHLCCPPDLQVEPSEVLF